MQVKIFLFHSHSPWEAQFLSFLHEGGQSTDKQNTRCHIEGIYIEHVFNCLPVLPVINKPDVGRISNDRSVSGHSMGKTQNRQNTDIGSLTYTHKHSRTLTRGSCPLSPTLQSLTPTTANPDLYLAPQLGLVTIYSMTGCSVTTLA